MAKNRLAAIADFGQSVWLDNISRPLLQSGELARLIEEDGITGLTSNPTIWEKAIAAGSYDADIAALAREGKTVTEIYETLAVSDLRAAADLLRPVFDRTNGADGYVSLEVAPELAHDAAGTAREARRLSDLVNRRNLMIKIPATPEGTLALMTCIMGGLNVNATLIFGLRSYEAVADAFISGLELRAERGIGLDWQVSVASFFVSRVDTAVDKLLAGKPGAAELQGQAAIANARLAYARFREITATQRWQRLAALGAKVQRPLWASTSTKNPAYPDTIYAEALIGPDTVDTMPPQTIDAFRDHGQAAETITQDLPEARAVMVRLALLGIDMKAVTDDLLAAGLASFAASYAAMMGGIGTKMDSLRGE